MNQKLRPSSSKSANQLFDYQPLEPRQLLACDHIGSVGAGIAVADDATGPGYIMYSQQDVQTRFSVPSYNADHFVAVRLEGSQWQFNNDVDWVDFERAATDRLMTEVNFTSDSVANSVSLPIVNGIQAASRFGRQIGGENVESDLWFNANRLLGAPNDGEFEILGTCFDKMVEETGLVLRNEQGSPIDATPIMQMGGNSVAAIPPVIGLNLEQIWTGLVAYESVVGQFPNTSTFSDTGEPLLSWRVEILPLLGFTDLYNQFNHDESWLSPHNLSLIGEMPDLFSSPRVSAPGRTSFQAVVGEQTLFRPSGEPVDLRDVQDGAGSTIAVVESDVDRAVFWTQPDTLSFNADDPLDGVGEDGTVTFHAVTVSGEVLQIAPGTDPSNFSNLLQIDDGNPVNLNQYDSELDLQRNLRTTQAKIGHARRC